MSKSNFLRTVISTEKKILSQFQYPIFWIQRFVRDSFLWVKTVRNETKDSLSRDGIFRSFRSPGIDSKEQIPPASVSQQAGTTTLLLLGSQPPLIVLKFQHCIEEVCMEFTKSPFYKIRHLLKKKKMQHGFTCFYLLTL